MSSKVSKMGESVLTPAVIDDATPAVQVVSIESLIPDAANVRKRDDRAKKSLTASLRQFGPARSIVLDAKGVVRAGNGTVEAAQEAGVAEVLVVKPRPGQLVAVQREDWGPSEATGYAIADNRIAELAHFDELALADQLHSLAEEGFEFEPMGFTLEEVEALAIDEGDGDEGDGGGGEIPPDDAPPVGQFGVIVHCRDESHQEEIYNRLVADGLDCKVVCV